MESMNWNMISILPNKPSQSLSHSAHTRVSEREGQYLLWFSISLEQYVGDTKCQNLSLTGTRASNNHNWTIYYVHGLSLGSIYGGKRLFKNSVGFGNFHGSSIPLYPV